MLAQPAGENYSPPTSSDSEQQSTPGNDIQEPSTANAGTQGNAGSSDGDESADSTPDTPYGTQPEQVHETTGGNRNLNILNSQSSNDTEEHAKSHDEEGAKDRGVVEVVESSTNEHADNADDGNPSPESDEGQREEVQETLIAATATNESEIPAKNPSSTRTAASEESARASESRKLEEQRSSPQNASEPLSTPGNNASIRQKMSDTRTDQQENVNEDNTAESVLSDSEIDEETAPDNSPTAPPGDPDAMVLFVGVLYTTSVVLVTPCTSVVRRFEDGMPLPVLWGSCHRVDVFVEGRR